MPPAVANAYSFLYNTNSMKEQLHPKARVFDFDDTLMVGKETFTRASSLIMSRMLSHRLPNIAIAYISQLNLNHGRVNLPINSIKEKISFELHARSKVYASVKDALERIAANGTDIYGNTGRPHKGDWVDMTQETLHKGGIAEYFKGVFYTPDGARTVVSKAHAVLGLTERYREIEFDDDDPRTAYFIANLFPGVKVNLVQHRFTGLFVSRSELDKLPNLRRVTVLGKR